MAKQGHLQAWQVSADDYPWRGTRVAQHEFLVRYALLAPSSHNTQPWRFRVAHDGIELFADPSRALPIIDPRGRQRLISCGAALFNLRLAMCRFGSEPLVQLFPDPARPQLLARIGRGVMCRPRSEARRLFDAIVRRRTNRNPFEQRPVADALSRHLAAAARREGAALLRLSPAGKRRAAQLIAGADRTQLRDRFFRRELAAWLSPPHARRPDGIPTRSRSFGVWPSAAPLWVRRFDIGGAVARDEHDLALGSPMLAVLATAGDDPRSWLRAGAALQRALLAADDFGMSASFLNQPLELSGFRARFAELIGAGHPQLIVRLGFGSSVAPTPRRSLAEVLVADPAVPAPLPPRSPAPVELH